MSLSFQLYSAREFQPWASVFSQLSASGYEQVEGFGALYDDPPRLAGLLEEHGLSMPTAHMDVEYLEDDPAAAVVLARQLGIRTVIGPFLAPDDRPSDAAGWKQMAARLDAIGKRLADDGLAFAWHNHDFELFPCPDGAIPLDVILDGAPDIGWEADLAWVVRGNADPLMWARTRADRIVAVHLKDIAPAGECLDEDGWADPGHGTIDWQALVDQLESDRRERIWIVEHDKPVDLERFTRRAMASATRFLGSLR